MEQVLTRGEWEALIHQAPDQVRHLIAKLAVHHGAIEKPSESHCPLCGNKPQEVRAE